MATDHPQGTGRRRPPRRVVVLADLAGDDTYHVGDEAMAEQTITWLRSLAPSGELEITVASSDPAASARRLGCAAVPWVGFADCADDAARAALAAQAGSAVRSAHPLLAAVGDAHPLLAAVADADALVVAGGGNLSSMWPAHVHERALAVAVAQRAGVPVAVTGQTLGPLDSGGERTLVARLLGAAVMVGVREPHSAAEARSLGVGDSRLVEAPDDAVFLPAERPVGLPGTLGGDPAVADRATNGARRRFIAVTVHPFTTPGHPRYDAIGHQLAELAQRVDAELVIVPHVRGADGPAGGSDGEVAGVLASVSGGTVLDRLTAPQAAWVSHNAWLVVSSRYHPLVFATAAAVPALALTHGHYTAVKCRGALGQVGCEPWWVDLETAADGLLLDAAGELARRRTEVADWMAAHHGTLVSRDAWRRWRLAAALGFSAGPAPRRAPRPDPERADAPRPAGEWAATRA